MTACSAQHGSPRRATRGRWLAAAVAIAYAIATAARADDERQRFDIPAGNAADVVNAIARASGASVLYPYEELRAAQAPAVQGDYTLLEALDTALADSGFGATMTEFGAVAITSGEQQPPTDLAAPPGPEPPPPPAPVRSAEVQRAPEPAPIDRIIVTGTRITRTGMDTPVPVTSVTRQELQRLSPMTLMDAVDQLPQFVNNATPEAIIGSSGSAGQSFLNLRGIGSNRTLLLVDGRRIVPSTRRGATDIAVLPEAVVDRVEIVTGGASAAYGSDAVAGVVNFILDRNLDGMRGHAQAGVSDRGDYGNYKLSLAAGFQLDQRTRLLLAADTYGNEGVPDALDRDWHRSWGLIRNRDPNGPTLLIAPNVVSSAYTYGGLIPFGPLAGTQFLPNGQTAPFDYGANTTFSVQLGGDGVDPARERNLSPDAERQSVFAHLSQEFSPRVTGYLQGLWGRSVVTFDKDPSYLQGAWGATIFIDNAYLPEDIRARMQAAGVDSFPFARYASRRDLSIGRVETNNQTASLTLGVEADVRDWRLNVYYQLGANQQDLVFHDAVRVDRIYRAMDAVHDPATGTTVCRSTLTFPGDGCVPTSFFGDGAVSQAAKEWILDDNSQVQKLNQQVAEITLDGDLFDTPAGTALAAFGASWRQEDFQQYNTPYTARHRTPTAEEAGYRGLPSIYSNGYPVVERAVTTRSSGEANVGELFAEVIVPLVSGAPFVRSLDLQTAARFAHYSGSGDIWAWKAGLDWELDRAVRLRGTLSRDVRGGTMAERFGVSTGGAAVTDPFLENSPVYSIAEFQTGNDAVAPERADTFTVGAVIRPGFLPGFSVSLDYYDVKIHDAISRPGVQAVVNGCFEGRQELCDLIVRNEEGEISRVTSTFLNLDSARTRGFDIEASYVAGIDLFGGLEQLQLRAIAAIYEEASFTPFDGTRVDLVGQTGPGGGLPDYQVLTSLTYFRDDFSFNLTGQHTSDGAYNVFFVEGRDINDNTVDGVWYVNGRAAYEFTTPRGPVELFFYVRNLFDEDPPVAPNTGGGFFGALHSPTDFDQIGRRYTVGLSWRF